MRLVHTPLGTWDAAASTTATVCAEAEAVRAIGFILRLRCPHSSIALSRLTVWIVYLFVSQGHQITLDIEGGRVMEF